MIGNYVGIGISLLTLAACAAPSPGAFSDPAPAADAARAPSTSTRVKASEIQANAVMDVTSASYRTSSQFTHVSAAPYPSTVAAGKMIDLWVSTSAYPEYARVRPDQTGSRAALPRGAVIVREVHEPSGALTAVTAMFKGEEGFNGALGDWGFIDATMGNGAPTDGGMSAGATAECFSCHIPRETDDYLFGVPPTARPGGSASDAGADAHADGGADARAAVAGELPSDL